MLFFIHILTYKNEVAIHGLWGLLLSSRRTWTPEASLTTEIQLLPFAKCDDTPHPANSVCGWLDEIKNVPVLNWKGPPKCKAMTDYILSIGGITNFLIKHHEHFQSSGINQLVEQIYAKVLLWASPCGRSWRCKKWHRHYLYLYSPWWSHFLNTEAQCWSLWDFILIGALKGLRTQTRNLT